MFVIKETLTEKKFPSEWLLRFNEAFSEGIELNFENLLRLYAMGINPAWFATHLCTDWKQAEAFLLDLAALAAKRKPYERGTVGEEIDLILKHMNSWRSDGNENG